MRGSILDKAKKVINGERQTQYGSPENSFEKIAEFWNVYLKQKLNSKICSEDVALMMVLFKIARLINNVKHEDSMLDACGYLALAYDMTHTDPKVLIQELQENVAKYKGNS